MSWKFRDARTDTCDMFYLESDEECILEVTAVTAIDNPHLNLIASAPELLEALEQIDSEAHDAQLLLFQPSLGIVRLIAQRAINKARGV